MREFWQKIFNFLKDPPLWFLLTNYAVTLVSAVGACCFLLVDYAGNILEYVAYALFTLAAISLAYTVYSIVKFAPTFKNKIVETLEKWEFTRNILQNFGFRTLIFAIGSFAMSVAYGVFNGVLGIASRSIWYGALAAYYILLAFLRGGLLLYNQNKRRQNNAEDDRLTQIRKYRNCGLLLIVLHLALSAAIAQMIFSDKHFSYEGWTVYAFAAYAFYKITMSIINLFRARKQDDLTVQAIRNINLTDATVSILALQTALLYTFTTPDSGVDISLFNTLTGSVVSIFCLSLGIFMVVEANKKRKNILTELTNEQR